MRVNNGNFLSIEQLQDQYLNQTNASRKVESAQISFRDVLEAKTVSEGTLQAGSLKFSKHAVNRLADRQITLSASQMERLSNGAKKAGEKGIQDSLVLMDQLAFIVNVPNSTVITAMDQTETYENVFTNIDGAVII
ncbi:MAG: flagellar protein [Lachnospiraceae bacterium]|nr:flagellar protein [Lachnospiraceae bacterium]